MMRRNLSSVFKKDSRANVAAEEAYAPPPVPTKPRVLRLPSFSALPVLDLDLGHSLGLDESPMMAGSSSNLFNATADSAPSSAIAVVTPRPIASDAVVPATKPDAGPTPTADPVSCFDWSPPSSPAPESAFRVRLSGFLHGDALASRLDSLSNHKRVSKAPLGPSIAARGAVATSTAGTAGSRISSSSTATFCSATSSVSATGKSVNFAERAIMVSTGTASPPVRPQSTRGFSDVPKSALRQPRRPHTGDSAATAASSLSSTVPFDSSPLASPLGASTANWAAFTRPHLGIKRAMTETHIPTLSAVRGGKFTTIEVSRPRPVDVLTPLPASPADGMFDTPPRPAPVPPLKVAAKVVALAPAATIQAPPHERQMTVATAPSAPASAAAAPSSSLVQNAKANAIAQKSGDDVAEVVVVAPKPRRAQRERPPSDTISLSNFDFALPSLLATDEDRILAMAQRRTKKQVAPVPPIEPRRSSRQLRRGESDRMITRYDADEEAPSVVNAMRRTSSASAHLSKSARTTTESDNMVPALQVAAKAGRSPKSPRPVASIADAVVEKQSLQAASNDFSVAMVSVPSKPPALPKRSPLRARRQQAGVQKTAMGGTAPLVVVTPPLPRSARPRSVNRFSGGCAPLQPGPPPARPLPTVPSYWDLAHSYLKDQDGAEMPVPPSPPRSGSSGKRPMELPLVVDDGEVVIMPSTGRSRSDSASIYSLPSPLTADFPMPPGSESSHGDNRRDSFASSYGAVSQRGSMITFSPLSSLPSSPLGPGQTNHAGDKITQVLAIPRRSRGSSLSATIVPSPLGPGNVAPSTSNAPQATPTAALALATRRPVAVQQQQTYRGSFYATGPAPWPLPNTNRPKEMLTKTAAAGAAQAPLMVATSSLGGARTTEKPAVAEEVRADSGSAFSSPSSDASRSGRSFGTRGNSDSTSSGSSDSASSVTGPLTPPALSMSPTTADLSPSSLGRAGLTGTSVEYGKPMVTTKAVARAPEGLGLILGARAGALPTASAMATQGTR